MSLRKPNVVLHYEGWTAVILIVVILTSFVTNFVENLLKYFGVL